MRKTVEKSGEKSREKIGKISGNTKSKSKTQSMGALSLFAPPFCFLPREVAHPARIVGGFGYICALKMRREGAIISVKEVRRHRCLSASIVFTEHICPVPAAFEKPVKKA